MKRLIIIGEGQTEQAFCNDVLQSYFNSRGIYIQNPTIKKTKGGIVSWGELKKQIENHLKQDNTVFVSLLIDYYGISSKHEFPNWAEAANLVDRNHRMTALEKGMADAIDDSLRHRFIPYVQLHEFEALLFSDKQIFDDSFNQDEFNDYAHLVEVFDTFSNPEDINNNRKTAPSKRLERIIKGYKSEKENLKVFYGSLLAQAIGLNAIRTKCPRFNHWITLLESI